MNNYDFTSHWTKSPAITGLLQRVAPAVKAEYPKHHPHRLRDFKEMYRQLFRLEIKLLLDAINTYGAAGPLLELVRNASSRPAL